MPITLEELARKYGYTAVFLEMYNEWVLVKDKPDGTVFTPKATSKYALVRELAGCAYTKAENPAWNELRRLDPKRARDTPSDIFTEEEAINFLTSLGRTRPDPSSSRKFGPDMSDPRTRPPKPTFTPPPMEPATPAPDALIFDLATSKGFRVNILKGTKDLFQLEPLPKGYKYDRNKQEPAHWGQATFVINPVNDTTVFTLEQAMRWLRSLPDMTP